MNEKELLMAHINTLDEVVGEAFKTITEDNNVALIDVYKNLMKAEFNLHVPESMREYLVADLYRDQLEERLKEL